MLNVGGNLLFVQVYCKQPSVRGGQCGGQLDWRRRSQGGDACPPGEKGGRAFRHKTGCLAENLSRDILRNHATNSFVSNKEEKISKGKKESKRVVIN